MLKAAEKRRLTNLVQQTLKERPAVRPFPAAVSRLLAACQDPNSTANTFEKIIECDPALAVRLLRMANSPMYGLSNQVRTIGHATAVLGIRQLKSLALASAGAGMFADGDTAAEKRQELWSHSLGCATVARLVAKLVRNVVPDNAFLAGIFHDVGKLFLFDVAAEEYTELVTHCAGEDLIREEAFLFGVSHPEIGLKSAHAWGLPDEIKAAIGHHHCPDASPVDFELVAVTYLADGFSKAWGIGFAGDPDWQPNERILEQLALDLTSLTNLQEQAVLTYEDVTRTMTG